MGDADQLSKFKEAFAKELEGITDVNELKEIYAEHIAKRDELIAKLQEQNNLLLASMIKQKKDDLSHASYVKKQSQ